MKTVGILGGMGPMATVDLFQKIVLHTPAKVDQDHIPMMIYNNPQIPSRIDAIVHGAASPAAELTRSAKLLEQAGADFIVIPCNTAHYWYDQIQAAVRIEVVHIIENAARRIVAQYQDDPAAKIMLFATAGTVKTGIYQKAFDRFQIRLHLPTAAEQETISLAIDGIKAGQYDDNIHLARVKTIMEAYHAQGVKAFIAGCTEVPFLFERIDGPFAKLDPTLLLAQKTIQMALE